jgi:hypothetical protein
LGGLEDPGGDRGSGGAVERAARGEDRESRVDQPQRRLAHEGAGEQDRGAGGETHLRHHQQASPVPRVQDRAAPERTRHEAEQVREPGGTDGRLRIGEVRHLDEHRDERELAARRRDEETCPQQPELARRA